MEDSATQALKGGSIEPSRAQAMMTPTAPASDGKDGFFAAVEHPGPNPDVPGEANIAPSPRTSNIESGLRPASVSSSPLAISEAQLRRQGDPSPAVNSRASSSTGASSTFRKGDYLEDREFGVDTSKGNGIVVAAMRDKYTRAVRLLSSARAITQKLVRLVRRRNHLEMFPVCH